MSSWGAVLSLEAGLILLFAFALIGAVLFVAAAYSGLLRKPQPVDPSGSEVAIPETPGSPARTLHLPGAAYVESMSPYVDNRRDELRNKLRGSKGEELIAVWSRQDAAGRHSFLQSQADEVALAVSRHVGGDNGLLHALCPELAKSSLAALAAEPVPMLELMRCLAAGKMPLSPSEAASTELQRIAAAVNAHLNQRGAGKKERAVHSQADGVNETSN